MAGSDAYDECSPIVNGRYSFTSASLIVPILTSTYVDNGMRIVRIVRILLPISKLLHELGRSIADLKRHAWKRWFLTERLGPFVSGI